MNRAGYTEFGGREGQSRCRLSPGRGAGPETAATTPSPAGSPGHPRADIVDDAEPGSTGPRQTRPPAATVSYLCSLNHRCQSRSAIASKQLAPPDASAGDPPD